MYELQTLNKISPLGLDLLDKAKFSVSDNPADPAGILVRSAKMHDMEFGKNLLAIARAGAGVNNIPLDKCAEEGIVVFNTPGANANAVKELVIASLFLASRNIVGGIEWAKTLQGKGDEVGPLVEKGKGAFVGPEITGKTLGVIGLGAIGAMVANTAISLQMNVYGYDPFITVDSAWRLSRAIKHANTTKEIFENSDYITLHIPATKDTKGMINKETIAQMKDGVRLINLSRGDLVNEDDLAEALESGKIAAYITDFPSEKVLAMKNAVAIPHLGASTPEAEDNCAVMAVKEIVDYLENGNITNSVNYPAVSLERGSHARVCILHKNIPNVLSQITAMFGDAGINIENMVSKSRNDYSYAILDVENLPDDVIVKKVSETEGVIRYRAIK